MRGAGHLACRDPATALPSLAPTKTGSAAEWRDGRGNAPTAMSGNTAIGCEHSETVNVKCKGYLLPIDRGAIPFTMQRQCRVGPNTGGEKNGRATQPAARAESARRVLCRRYRGRAGALHRRRRFHRLRADRHPAAYGPPPRQGRGAADVADRPRPLFQHALRGADHRRRGRQGRGASARVLHASAATTASCNSTSRCSTPCATAASRRSARSSIPSIWCSRCSSATSPRCWPRAGRRD